MAEHLAATCCIGRSLEACVATAFGPLGCDRFVRYALPQLGCAAVTQFQIESGIEVDMSVGSSIPATHQGGLVLIGRSTTGRFWIAILYCLSIADVFVF